MIKMLAIGFIGFSIFSAILLLITHFRCSDYKESQLSRLAGMTLIVSLAILQIAHNDALNGGELVSSLFYKLCLFSVAPAFYFFSRQLLQVQSPYSHHLWLHLLPLFLAPFLSYQQALPLSFIIGGGYLSWLAYTIYQLRDQRSRFKEEILALAILFIIAISVLILGLFMPLLSTPTFYAFYAINIGLAFFVTLLILLRSPMITTEVTEAVQAAYVASTLKNVNIDHALLTLEKLMGKDKLYNNEGLQLNTLAKIVKLSPHQLSELINTQLDKSFSQYLREVRINAAKQLLIEEPNASVLSIGLEVGFTSQSNFYAAFQQIEKMAPGQFRKKNQGYE